MTLLMILFIKLKPSLKMNKILEHHHPFEF